MTGATFKIKAESTGGILGGAVSATAISNTITVILEPSLNLLVVNNIGNDGAAGTLNASTTQSLTVTNGRYRVFNNEPYAIVGNQGGGTWSSGFNVDDTAAPNTSPADHDGNGSNHFRGATIVYVDVPFVANEANFQPIGIQVRMRITRERDAGRFLAKDDAPGDDPAGLNQGVIVGAFGDPTTFASLLTYSGEYTVTNGAEAPALVGWRRTAGGNIRGYTKRTEERASGDRTSRVYGALTPPNDVQDESTNFEITNLPSSVVDRARRMYGQFNMTDMAFTIAPEGQPDAGEIRSAFNARGDAFRHQEVIFRMTRDTFGSWEYNAAAMNAAGQMMWLGEFNPDGNNAPVLALRDDTPFYLGVIIYGVEAELSDIAIIYDGATWDNPAWVDAAVANPPALTLVPFRVDIFNSAGTTVFPTLNTNEYEDAVGSQYSELKSLFDDATLSASIVPYTFPQTGISWSGTGSVVPQGTTGAQMIFEFSGTAGAGKAIVTTTPIAPIHGARELIFWIEDDD